MTHENKALESLLPCPFCGSKPIVWENSNYFHVGCDSCFFSIRKLNKPVVMELWNNQVALSSKPQKVDWDEFCFQFFRNCTYRKQMVDGSTVELCVSPETVLRWLKDNIDQQQTQPKGGQG